MSLYSWYKLASVVYLSSTISNIQYGNICTPNDFDLKSLKLKLVKRVPNRVLPHNNAGGKTNSKDCARSSQGLHCLGRPVCRKTWDHYGYSTVLHLV